MPSIFHPLSGLLAALIVSLPQVSESGHPTRSRATPLVLSFLDGDHLAAAVPAGLVIVNTKAGTSSELRCDCLVSSVIKSVDGSFIAFSESKQTLFELDAAMTAIRPIGELPPSNDRATVLLGQLEDHSLVFRGTGGVVTYRANPSQLVQHFPWPEGFEPLEGGERTTANGLELLFKSAKVHGYEQRAFAWTLSVHDGRWSSSRVVEWSDRMGFIEDRTDADAVLCARYLPEGQVRTDPIEALGKGTTTLLDYWLPEAIALSPGGRQLVASSSSRSIGPGESSVGTVGGDLEIFEVGIPMPLFERPIYTEIDQLEEPPHYNVVGRDLAFLGSESVATLDWYESGVWLRKRDARNLSIQSEVFIEGIKSMLMLASNESGSAIAVRETNESVLLFDASDLSIKSHLAYDHDGGDGEYMAVSPSGKRVAIVGSDDHIWWNDEEDSVLRSRLPLPGHLESVADLVFDSSGALVLLARTELAPADNKRDRRIGLSTWSWRPSAASWHRTARPIETSGLCAVLDPSGKYVSHYEHGSGNTEVFCRSLETGQMRWKHPLPATKIKAVAASTSGILVVQVADSRDLLVLDRETGAQLKTIALE